MPDPNRNKPETRASDLGIVFIAAASLLMIIFTFVVSNMEVELSKKYVFLAPGAVVYIAASFFIFRWQRRSLAVAASRIEKDSFGSDVEAKLATLSDANEFFGASLRPDDLFRLVASRIGDIVPFSSCVLYVRDQESGILRVKCALGENAPHFAAGTGALGRGIAAIAADEGGTVRDSMLEVERDAQAPEALRGLSSAIATPLRFEGETFGSLVLYSSEKDDFSGDSERHFEAAAARVAPLIAGSFAFEQSIDNALTDPVTSLPNERGFYLVLESRIAESHRFRDAKALAVLAMDVQGFSDFNETFGHSIGNRLLAHVASVAKNQLRQMDVITRSSGDEFLAVLPTASESVTVEIVNRLRKAFEEKPFAMDHGTSFAVNLNFGSAAFGRDGETAQSLLQMARAKKHESKSKEGKVLFFPKESVN